MHSSNYEDSNQLALFYGKCVLAVHYILYRHKREYHCVPWMTFHMRIISQSLYGVMFMVWHVANAEKQAFLVIHGIMVVLG